MSRTSVTVEIGPRHTTWLHGQSFVIRPILRRLRCPSQYDRTRRALQIPSRFADDFCAAAELWAGVDLVIERVAP